MRYTSLIQDQELKCIALTERCSVANVKFCYTMVLANHFITINKLIIVPTLTFHIHKLLKFKKKKLKTPAVNGLTCTFVVLELQD